jgi:transposase
MTAAPAKRKVSVYSFEPSLSIDIFIILLFPKFQKQITAQKSRKGIPQKPLTDLLKGIIIEALANGKSCTQIAKDLDRSVSTISAFKRKYEATGISDRGFSPGRPRKSTLRMDRIIRRCVLTDRQVTTLQIQDALGGPVLSKSTICRRIHDLTGFTSWFKLKKNFVSEKNRKIRLDWAKEHLNWTVEQWRTVIWSDESPFVLRYAGRERVWRLCTERYEPWACKATVKHDVKINVWGCFSGSGVGDLVKVNGILETQQMLRILEGAFLPSLRRLHPAPEQSLFQQDNDTKHTSRLVQAWLRNLSIPVMIWPSQSPDLNPIENLWSILDRRLKTRRPQNEQQLFEVLREGWSNLERETCC